MSINDAFVMPDMLIECIAIRVSIGDCEAIEARSFHRIPPIRRMHMTCPSTISSGRNRTCDQGLHADRTPCALSDAGIIRIRCRVTELVQKSQTGLRTPLPTSFAACLQAARFVRRGAMHPGGRWRSFASCAGHSKACYATVMQPHDFSPSDARITRKVRLPT